MLLFGLCNWYEGPVGNSGGDIKESLLLRECFELLFTISGHFRFRPGGLELIVGSSLAFGTKCGNPAAVSPRPDDKVLGRTLWVGGKEEAEDAGILKDGDMDVRLLLLLYDSDAEEALPASYVSSASSFMNIWSILCHYAL
jgi:hypothetical protein